jgi:hypothetical protein
MNNTDYKDFQNIVEKLLKTFPEFESSTERKEVYDNDGPYTYMSYFGDFLLSKIEEGSQSEFIQRTFSFINSSFEDTSFNSTLWDLFLIEIFERLDMEDKYTNVANHYLKGKALIAFQTREGRP